MLTNESVALYCRIANYKLFTKTITFSIFVLTPCTIFTPNTSIANPSFCHILNGNLFLLVVYSMSRWSSCLSAVFYLVSLSVLISHAMTSKSLESSLYVSPAFFTFIFPVVKMYSSCQLHSTSPKSMGCLCYSSKKFSFWVDYYQDIFNTLLSVPVALIIM